MKVGGENIGAPEIERVLRVELARHCRAGGEIVMQSSSWTITETKPVA